MRKFWNIYLWGKKCKHLSHRSTTYRCCLPTLAEFAGAGRRYLRVQR